MTAILAVLFILQLTADCINLSYL